MSERVFVINPTLWATYSAVAIETALQYGFTQIATSDGYGQELVTVWTRGGAE